MREKRRNNPQFRRKEQAVIKALWRLRRKYPADFDELLEEELAK